MPFQHCNDNIGDAICRHQSISDPYQIGKRRKSEDSAECAEQDKGNCTDKNKD